MPLQSSFFGAIHYVIHLNKMKRIEMLVYVCQCVLIFLMSRRAPRYTQAETLLPSTTLFRSLEIANRIVQRGLELDSVQLKCAVRVVNKKQEFCNRLVYTCLKTVIVYSLFF